VARTSRSRPGVTLLVFVAIIGLLYGLMALQNSWFPRLGLDLRGGTTITLTARNLDPAQGGAVDSNSLEQARTIIQNRVDSIGVGESEVSVSGANQIVVSVPNMQKQELIELVGQTAVLSFRMVYLAQTVAPPTDPSASPTTMPTGSGTPSGSANPSASATGTGTSPSATESATGNRRPAPALPTVPPAAAGTDIPDDQVLTWTPTDAEYQAFLAYTCDQPVEEKAAQPLVTCNEDGTEKFLLGPTMIDGADLSGATAGIPQGEVNWAVDLTFKPDAAQVFLEATTKLAQNSEPQNRFAIVLDGKSISEPTVSNAIPGGSAQITGNFNQGSATRLANLLKYGSLPLAFDISSVDTVSATLGGEQLEAGIIAGAIGLALVLLFAIAYYRGLFIVVAASLAIAAAMTYALMVLLGESMGFALSLPGIAGAIVAIGVTADSFIIYFERIRDEVREGRTIRSAVETGWHRAKHTIVIADSVSLLSAVVLFILAVGQVKGFAFTLGLTTVIDLAVVVFFTKPLMSLLARTKFFGGGHPLSGFDAGHLGVERLPGRARVGRTA